MSRHHALLCVCMLVCRLVQHFATAAGKDFVEVSTSDSLLIALQNSSVSTIVVTNDVTIRTEHRSGHSAYALSRNVTISAADGVVLDLGFESEWLHLCTRCRLQFANVTIANARRGTGDGFDGIAGDPGSILLLNDVIDLRMACTSAADTATVMDDTPRSVILPQSSNRHQQYNRRSISFEGIVYPDSLVLMNYTVDVPLTLQEMRGHFGGIAVGQTNVSRVCLNYVTESCLQTKSPDACVNALIDVLLAQQQSPHNAGPSAGTKAAAITVSVVIGCAMMVLATCMYLRKRRILKAQQQSSKPAGPQADLHKPHAPGALCHADSAMEAALRRKLSIEVRIVKGDQPPPLGGKSVGWQLVAASTSPLLGSVPEDVTVVKFGDLLGSGSFGRVYRAEWAGRDCAVKVIEHDADTLTAVEAEAQLMLSFEHPNLVRAFHYVTYKQEASATSGISRQSSGSSAASARRRAAQSKLAMKAEQASNSASQSEAGRLSLTGGSDNTSNSGGRKHSLPHVMRQPSVDAIMGVNCSAGSSSAAHPASAGSRGSRGDADQWQVLQQGDSDKCETWLVQEYCDLGTLGSVAAHSWSPLQECDEQMLQRLLLLQDTAMGLAALHAEATVHGDLNARNVLVSSCDTCQTGMVAKLADLGLSRVIKQHKTHRTTQTVGTMSHMPPELLRYGRLSPAVDVYSFGMLMWEVFTCRAAFDKLHYGQFFETVVLQNLRPIVPSSVPQDYEILMKQCWAAEPSDRPSVQQVLTCLDYMIKDRQHRMQDITAHSLSASGATASSCVQAVAAVVQVGSPARPAAPQRCPSDESSETESSSTASGASEGWRGFVQLGQQGALLEDAGSPSAAAAVSEVQQHGSRHDSVHSSDMQTLQSAPGPARFSNPDWFV